MLNLYYKPTCPYSTQVLAANQSMGAVLTLRNVLTDVAAREELLAKGGKSQTPFLEDTARGVLMYESLDIIAYLHKNYGSNSAPVVTEVGNVCPIE